MSSRTPTRRVVLTLLRQSGGTLTVPVNDPNQAALRHRLQELAVHGRVQLATRSQSSVTYTLPTSSQRLPQRFQPSDANG